MMCGPLAWLVVSADAIGEDEIASRVGFVRAASKVGGVLLG